VSAADHGGVAVQGEQEPAALALAATRCFMQHGMLVSCNI
jgi:hypothetical protein